MQQKEIGQTARAEALKSKAESNIELLQLVGSDPEYLTASLDHFQDFLHSACYLYDIISKSEFKYLNKWIKIESERLEKEQ